MIRSPFKDVVREMPKVVKGRDHLPTAKKQLDSAVPMGETFNQEKPGPINSPYQVGNQKMMPRVRGPKNK